MEIKDPMPALLAVLAVLAVLGATLWWLRKKGAVRLLGRGMRRAPRRLATLDRLTLSPHHALHLVRLDDRALLVAQSPSGLALLDTALLDTALLDTSGERTQAPAQASRAAAGERG